VAFYLTAGLIYILDQGTKFFISSRMSLYDSLPVIDNVFHLTLIKNYGAAFGILPHMRAFFVVMHILVIVLVLFFIRQIPVDQRWLRLGLALQLGGATGNLTDRLRLGYVLDFLDFRIWPVFNVADMAIVAGVFSLALGLWRISSRQEG
jgi:signal peptidase II